jgi:hypothetical protein
MAIPNLLLPTALNGKTVGIIPGTTGFTDIVNNTVTGHSFYIKYLNIANNTASTTITFSCRIVKTATAPFLLQANTTLAAGQSFQVIGADNPVTLEETDKIQVQISVASSCDVVCSYDDIS